MSKSANKSLAPALMSLSLGLLAGAMEWFYIYGAAVYEAAVVDFPALQRKFAELLVPEQVSFLQKLGLVAGVVFLLAALAAPVRIKATLKLLRGAYYAAYLVGAWYIFKVFQITGLLIEHEIKLLGSDVTALDLFDLRVAFTWPVWLALVWVAFWHTFSWRHRVIAEYLSLPPQGEAVGDLIFEDVRTHGNDPRHRKSVYGAVFLHIFVLFILPWMLEMWGCVEPYKIPKGSGNPVVALVKIVKPKKKPKKKLVSNPNSAIIFEQPDIDDSDILQQVEIETQLIHEADTQRVHGNPGQGGGKKGGWPDGMEDAEVRFIYLEYNGSGWDDGLGEGAVNGNSDANFLKAFTKLTGFKTRRRGESNRIRDLKKYPPGQGPPFLFMTGDGSININRAEMKILRDYLLDGGMLFADAGTRQWDRSFKSFLTALMPDQRILPISNDDPIFRQPYPFPNGTPYVSPHGGTQAKGIKIRGRWVVYYSPVDLNDAWKDGYHGVVTGNQQQCYQMGVNIIYYAFTHYLIETRKYRK